MASKKLQAIAKLRDKGDRLSKENNTNVLVAPESGD